MSFFEFPHTRTYDSDLGWLIKEMRKIIDETGSSSEWKSKVDAELEELEACCDSLMSGDFPESFKDALVTWMRNNALDIIGELIKMVFFGLTDSGYFVAYIPESWDDIIFNTTDYDIFIADFNEYGHLVLSY